MDKKPGADADTQRLELLRPSTLEVPAFIAFFLADKETEHVLPQGYGRVGDGAAVFVLYDATLNRNPFMQAHKRQYPLLAGVELQARNRIEGQRLLARSQFVDYRAARRSKQSGPGRWFAC